MMRVISPFFLMVSAAAMLAACTQTPAQVVDNSQAYYGRSSQDSWAVRSSPSSLHAPYEYGMSGSGSGAVSVQDYDYGTASSAPTETIGVVESMQPISVSELPAEASAAQPPIPMRDASSISSSDLAPPSATPSYDPALHEELQEELRSSEISSVAPAPVAESSTVHVVQQGETLYGIARQHGIDVHELARLNGSDKPSDIKVQIGQRLVLPGRESAREQLASRPIPDTTPSEAMVAETQMAAPAPPAPVMSPMLSSSRPGEFIWPVKGPVISRFGTKQGGLQNDGVNISAPAGTPIYAAEEGIVAYVGNELKGYGNLIIIRHHDGWITAYAHTGEISVKTGDAVRKGQMVATVGSTGNVSKPQLHFAIRKGKKPVDPLSVLS